MFHNNTEQLFSFPFLYKQVAIKLSCLATDLSYPVTFAGGLNLD